MVRPDLALPSELRNFLRRHGFFAKKSLGQHWLVGAAVVRRIAEACAPAGGLLEIGPGPGTITQRLVLIAPTIALDIDLRSKPALAEAAPDAEVVIADVLETDLCSLLSRLEPPRVVVSNLPYYITAAIIERICDAADMVDRAVLMMQREVADRLAAEPGDSSRGSLSVFVQFHFEVRNVCRVPPSAFLPPPKVESRVLSLERRASPSVPDLRRLFDLVRAGFRHPRKTLAHNLVASAIVGRAEVDALLRDAEIDGRARPHLLDEAAWVRLAIRVRTPRS